MLRAAQAFWLGSGKQLRQRAIAKADTVQRWFKARAFIRRIDRQEAAFALDHHRARFGQ